MSRDASKENKSKVGAYYYIKCLEKENKTLVRDNKELAKKLNAKRYKVMDFFVDSTYAVLRHENKRKKLIKRNLDVKLKHENYEFPKGQIIRGRIDIINVNFYDWDGEILYKGGAERYVFDLACLLKKMGYKPRILQCSNKPFQKKYRGIDVIGVGEGDKNNMKANSLIFAQFCRDAELIIASPLELACEITDVKVVGINHGINFDGDWNHYNKNYMQNYEVYMNALKNVKNCVCVDTNFINWTRTIDYTYSAKEKYIPNYYDPEKFEVVNKKKTNKVVFVYPRRIYNARGADITIEAFHRVLEKYKDRVILNFVGQIDNEEIGKKLSGLMEKYNKNVFHYEYDMSEMPKAYKDADVVLVPTRYCEGTSLSCIEGMVSGAAIITTTVGGLPNLVIDGFNGRLIAPSVDELVGAVIEMIEKPELRHQMAKNAKNIAKSAFSKENWDKKWKNLISGLMESA